jgi:fructose-1,6-bisphosphatase/inositol monophosphatase family enzyme
VCVGLVVKKQPVVGVVYNPVSKELFSAVDGGGAYLSVDGASPMRIRPSAVAQVPRSPHSQAMPPACLQLRA